MNLFKSLCFGLVFFVWSKGLLTAQTTINYSFKKGETLDVFFFLEKEDINKDSLFDVYRKVLFPIAMEYSFQPNKGFGIKETLRGGYQPSFMGFGKWENLKKRREFIREIVKHVPAFHDMRREIWSSFDLTYYELREELNFSVDKTKYTVATAYWGKVCEPFIDQWKALCASHGGKLIIQLEEGESPSGYYYNPDYFLISEWPNSTTFEEFSKQVEKINSSCILNINEFRIL